MLTFRLMSNVQSSKELSTRAGGSRHSIRIDMHAHQLSTCSLREQLHGLL